MLDDPPDVYDPGRPGERKTDAVFDHIFASYYDDGPVGLRHGRAGGGLSAVVAVADPARQTVVDDVDVDRAVTLAVPDQIRSDPRLAERRRKPSRARRFFAVPSAELLAGDEDF